MSGKTVLLFDMGSYCDFNLTEAVVDELLRTGFTVYHVTDNKNSKRTDKAKVVRILYDLPVSVRSAMSNADQLNSTADGKVSHLINESSIDAGLFFAGVYRSILKHVVGCVDVMLVHYPALPLLVSIPQSVLENIPTCIFYVAPAYPNYSVPWVFVDRLRDPSLALRDPTQKDYNLESTLWMYSVMGAIVLQTNKLINLVKSADIIVAWDVEYFPPVAPYEQLKPVTYAGAILDRADLEADHSANVPRDVAAFVSRNEFRKLVYMSLGSFGFDVFPVVKAFLSDPSTAIIYHDLSKAASDELIAAGDFGDRLLIHTTSFPHAWIVPRCSVIATTGSICLVNIALYHAIPLVILPLLNEQFMWAKNYATMSGVPYIDPSAGNIDYQARRALESALSPNTSKFMKSVRKSVRESDGCKAISLSVQRVVAQRPITARFPELCGSVPGEVQIINKKLRTPQGIVSILASVTMFIILAVVIMYRWRNQARIRPSVVF